MDQPKWLDEAWRELGQREIAGATDNPRIVALYRDAGHPAIRNDETAWCAAFAGACLKRAGAKGSGSLMARSYLAWGDELHAPRPGSIAVLSRGGNAALGHVGFVVGETRDSLILLGGNQSDAVSVAAFPRSRLLGLRWPASTSAQAVPAKDEAVFARALAHVFEMEGGYDDDPYDPGGPTNKGITLRVFAEWKGVTADAPSLAKLKDELKRIPDTAARDIYHARYWQTASCAVLPRGLSLMHFDAAVNHGVGTANRFLQEALGVAADGEIGPNTLAAAAACSVSDVLNRYAAIRRKRYRSLNHFWRFGRGWLARVDATLAAANSERAAKFSPTEKGLTPMPTSSMPDAIVPTAPVKPKWWGDSITIWGAMISALATVVPVLASAGGITLTPDLVRDFGTHAAAAVQAVVALTGTIVTIYGRLRATQPLERRAVSLKI